MIRQDKLGDSSRAQLRRLAELRRAGIITLAGNRKLKIYGTLRCRSGRRLNAASRVFFRDVADAEVHGYRPCGHCLREAYRAFCT